MLEKNNPRVILISQWPNVKNAEYELIEKIRQTGYKISVVDYFGFDVQSGKCINNATLMDEYDFAISFHYDTPKFLNIRTFLWIANPLEYMHLRGDYRNILVHHLRAYDGYLYNGSAFLKKHIKQVVGDEWVDDGLEFFASCSRRAMVLSDQQSEIKNKSKIFYCGVNWERGLDKAGRAQGLLDILQEKQVADFYGPKNLEGMNPWAGFSSYQGEIPFDGISMSKTMQNYAAVLAVSSPAHIKSQTSSSRVFEGLAAGVPVISDENPHVTQLFGDLIYYFSGDTEQARASSIMQALEQILANPKEAMERVRKAQQLIVEKYCFEKCLENILMAVQSSSINKIASDNQNPVIDVFLFHHTSCVNEGSEKNSFNNISSILKAAEHAVKQQQARVKIFYLSSEELLDKKVSVLPKDVELISLSTDDASFTEWSKLRLGEKVAKLANYSQGDFVVFLTQWDFPQHDYFTKPLQWFQVENNSSDKYLYASGFYANNLREKAPLGTVGIIRNNASVGLYRWSQNSIAEHQLGQFCFSKHILHKYNFEKIARFDVLLPVAIILEGLQKEIFLHRERHILLRVYEGYFHSHYEAYTCASTKGFWAQHYELLSNYNHELNALYDTFHESHQAVQIIDQVSGHSLPPIIPTDPAVHRVNHFLTRLRPLYRLLRKVKRVFSYKVV